MVQETSNCAGGDLNCGVEITECATSHDSSHLETSKLNCRVSKAKTILPQLEFFTARESSTSYAFRLRKNVLQCFSQVADAEMADDNFHHMTEKIESHDERRRKIRQKLHHYRQEVAERDPVTVEIRPYENDCFCFCFR